jgi:excisionase family DNA binding protein
MLHKGATQCDLKATPKKVAFFIDNQLFIIVLSNFFATENNNNHMINDLVVLQRSELDRIMKEAVEKALKLRAPAKKRLNLDEAVAYLNESGVPISKSTVYKNTMDKTIPFSRFGDRRIVFNVEDLDRWVEDRLAKRQNTVTESVRQSARRKM